MDLICTVAFEAPEVEAGGTLEGRVRLLEDTSAVRTAQSMRLRAICRIEGPGEPESRVLSIAELPGPFHPRMEVPFTLSLPERVPTSYQGIVLRIGWHLLVQLMTPEDGSPE
ncbi:MAG: hypothetical protein ACJ8AT_14785, partial [Hyalangium sp.]|uniref:hypothetical protein n=1 Tax=Hyalangium sp. TaxID=2028555 RepID=UPI00389A0651